LELASFFKEACDATKLENFVALLKLLTLHFKAGVKMVSSALCYNFLKHIRGRKKKGVRNMELRETKHGRLCSD